MSNKYEDLIKNARMNADCGEHMSPAEVTTLLNVVEITFAALAAENAALSKFIDDECYVYGPHDVEPVDAALEKPETPATDAFLSEVRASGVEMFAASLKVVGGGEHPYSAVANEFADQLRKGVQS